VSRKQGSSVLIRGEHWTAAAVTPIGAQKWRVDELAHGPRDARPPADLARAWAAAQNRTLWLVPDGEARTSLLTAPKLKGRALDRAVRGLVARDEGGAPEDWSVAWQAGAAPHRDDAREIFAVFTAQADLARHLATAEAWGRRPAALLPSHVALEQFYRAHGPEAGEHEAWNLVFVGRDERFLCVATRTGVLLLRDLPEDLSGGADPQEYLERLATEVERSVFFAKQTEHSPQVARIVVCGEPSLAAGLVRRLDDEGPAPALHWELERCFDRGARPIAADDLLALAGAALALDQPALNLLPRVSQASMSRVFRRRLLVGAAACAAAVVPVLLVGGVLTARAQREYLAQARADLRAARARAEQAEQVYRAQRVLLARESRITRFAAEKPDLEGLLHRLAAVTPAQVVFRDMQISERDDGRFALQLAGESLAPTGEEAQAAFLQFLDALRGSGFVATPDEPTQLLIKPWTEDGAAGHRTMFRLDLLLKNGADDEGA
jgi:hypothetical protein